ncbi:36647_t:CDS:1, partial [Racocetra persica]
KPCRRQKPSVIRSLLLSKVLFPSKKALLLSKKALLPSEVLLSQKKELY